MMRLKSVVLLLTCVFAANCKARPRFIFIDAGAHFGESYLAFQKCRLYPEHKWEVFAIEANPVLASKLPRAPRLTVMSKAVWISEGKMDFLIEYEDSGRNSMFKENFWENKPTKTISVDTFDFSEWVKQFSPNDYVIVSMDIEGAEFEVINKMIKDGTFKRLDRFYAEMHWNVLEKRKGMARDQAYRESRALLREVERQGPMVGEDSIEDIMRRGAWTDFLM
jgi:FkbM family methyltransferase